jgi:lysozyme
MKYNIATLEQPKKFTELSYIVHNYLGTPVVITDKDGNAKQSIKRNVYGEVTTNTINTDEVLNTSFGYTGHKYDADSNLTYAHARYLNTANSVFLSQDPLHWSMTEAMLYNPQMQNSYSYAVNNPVNFMDPTGNSAFGNWLTNAWTSVKNAVTCFCSVTTYQAPVQNTQQVQKTTTQAKPPEPNKQTLDKKTTSANIQTTGVKSVSQQGVEFIMGHEGFVGSIYKDAVNKNTIGYGHLIGPGEDFSKGLTKAQAENLLNNDIATKVKQMNQYITRDLTQNQFDAVASLVFNVGIGSKVTPSLIKLVNSENISYEEVERVFSLYNKGQVGGEYLVLPGLVSRRSEEAKLYFYGEY